ncbi:hypothetical protein C8R46DRAFT_49316 [Mycena filopes]|nr:hypothetical protein C8R46DRAFT_49316 [Mycena filopes]
MKTGLSSLLPQIASPVSTWLILPLPAALLGLVSLAHLLSGFHRNVLPTYLVLRRAVRHPVLFCFLAQESCPLGACQLSSFYYHYYPSTMDSEGYPEGGFPAMDSPAFASEGGTFFAGSHDFTINNGVFHNITTMEAPVVPPDVRKIPLGDIDLQTPLRADELYFDEETGLVRRRSYSRRVYSAKVGRQGENMTVVVYEGEAAEQGWHWDAAKYLNIRHPNVLQIYGVAASRVIHASLFHGDLIPYEKILEHHTHSPILTTYITAYVVCSSGTPFPIAIAHLPIEDTV